MEEEVRKHVKNIYKGATNPTHSFIEKLKEITIEIFIIVFAVSLSIWLHNWSERRHEKKVAREFLKGLRSDLEADKKQIESNREQVGKLLAMYDTLFYHKADAHKSVLEDTTKYRFYVDIITTRPNLGRYEGFKSSGKMETIEDDSLKQAILAYFQQTTPDLAISENFINSLQLKLLDQRIDQANISSGSLFFSSPNIKTRLLIGRQNLVSITGAYDAALQEIKDIIGEIDRELKQ